MSSIRTRIWRRVARASSVGSHAAVAAGMRLQQPAAVLLVEDRAAVERIDDEAVVRIVGVQIVEARAPGSARES